MDLKIRSDFVVLFSRVAFKVDSLRYSVVANTYLLSVFFVEVVDCICLQC